MPHLIMPLLAAAAASVLSTAAASADLGDQLFKLLPDDGAAGDNFGFSVAISGATAIVGAHRDDDNGDTSGSAYLFDISDPTNPTPTATLLPNDGAECDPFGESVATPRATAPRVAPPRGHRGHGFQIWLLVHPDLASNDCAHGKSSPSPRLRIGVRLRTPSRHLVYKANLHL